MAHTQGFPISRSLSTSRRMTDELGSRLERPIHFKCKLNEPMHIGMRLLYPAAAHHSVSTIRQQVQHIFSFSAERCYRSAPDHPLQCLQGDSGAGGMVLQRRWSSRVEWAAHIRLHYPLFVLLVAISPVRFSTLKE